MSDILAKISSYNVFNYLFPGAVFAFVCERLDLFKIGTDNLVLVLFVYYFVGLTISRVGSVVLEPLLDWTGLVKFAPYSDFVRAEEKDPKLQILVEVSNTYRTLTAMFLCLLGVYFGQKLVELFSIYRSALEALGVVALFVLYLLSYRKQSAYIKRRIEHHK